MKKLKIFIKGETINLSKPTLEFAKKSNWYSWLNDKEMIKHLNYKYKTQKNTPAKQVKFYLSERKKRFMLIVSTKNNVYKGIVSLSNFNKGQNSCDIALITDSSIDPYLAPYAALEAIARISEYAFKNLGIKTIYGIAKIKLKFWLQRMELFGYKLSTIKDYYYVNNKKLPFHILISCSYEDYKKIKKKRKYFWDNLENMKKRINKLPKKNMSDIYLKFMDNYKKRYYKKIFNL